MSYKISGLPSASGMNNPDVIPVVQSGANKKIAFGTFVDSINLDQNQVTDLVTDLADKSDITYVNTTVSTTSMALNNTINAKTYPTSSIVSGVFHPARLGNNWGISGVEQMFLAGGFSTPTFAHWSTKQPVQDVDMGGFGFTNVNAINVNGSIRDASSVDVVQHQRTLNDLNGTIILDFAGDKSNGACVLALSSNDNTATISNGLTVTGSAIVGGVNVLSRINTVSNSVGTTSIALHNTDVTNSAALNNSLIVGLNTWAARTASQNVDMDGYNITNCFDIQFQSATDGSGSQFISQTRILYDDDELPVINWGKTQSNGGILTFNRANETATLGMSLTLTDAPLYCNTLNTQVSNQWYSNIGQTNQASLKADNLSTNRIIQLPDIAGNLASEVYADSSSSTVSIAINNRLTPIFSTTSVIASTITTANLRATATINAGTATINNLRQTNIVPRSTTTTSTGGVSTELVNYDIFSITALSQTCTINPAIAGNNGQRVLFEVKDNGSPKSVVFQTPSVRAFSGLTLTQTTTASKISYYELCYSAANTCWNFINSKTEN